jgi:hypothetical protein
VVALQPWQQVEVGGRVGFGSTDLPPGLDDGSGATDLDLWGKYYLGGGTDTEFAVGGVVTVPTGDESEGLGADAFSISGFGALRYRMAIGILTANAGVRMNGDGQVFGSAELDGQVSGQLGVGWLWPWTDAVTFVGELDYESERFDGAEDDTRALAGINWGVGNRGQLRGAVAFGLSDGSPDSQIIAGYAYSF